MPTDSNRCLHASLFTDPYSSINSGPRDGVAA